MLPWAQGLALLSMLAALGVYLLATIRVAQARRKYGVAAPAVTGAAEFERAFRVQQNTLEQLPLFLVSLYLFMTFVSALGAALLGFVWVVGRLLYLAAYSAAAEKRAPGFLISIVATLTLFAGAIIGVVLATLRGLT